jgi:hypothetical protein
MPLVRTFHKGIRFIAIPFLGFADKLFVIAFVIAFNVFQVVIGKLAVFLFEFPLNCIHFPLSYSAFILASSCWLPPVFSHLYLRVRINLSWHIQTSPLPTIMTRRPAAV